MNVRLYLAVFAVAFLPINAAAQGFAGLGQTVDGYAQPSKELRFNFPSDHGPHPTFRIEWWYVTANLEGPNGTPYGIQWTLFRNALNPDGEDGDQTWMAHAAISSPEGHFVAERLARGELGHAGVSAEPFTAFIDEWTLSGPSLNDIILTAQGTDFSIALKLHSSKSFVAQGENGYSVKAEGGLASHYYSQPFYSVTGTLTLPYGDVEVTGQGWLDREWSSQPLAPTQTGWDWVSIHFENGEKLMAFQLRDESGSNYTVGTWITASGEPSPFEPGEIVMDEVSKARVSDRDIPVVWDLEIPSRAVDLRIRAYYPQSWMNTSVSYWEGPVEVSGSHNGVGYLEMTGYE